MGARSNRTCHKRVFLVSEFFNIDVNDIDAKKPCPCRVHIVTDIKAGAILTKLVVISRKLHENEEMLAQRRGTSLFPQDLTLKNVLNCMRRLTKIVTWQNLNDKSFSYFPLFPSTLSISW